MPYGGHSFNVFFFKIGLIHILTSYQEDPTEIQYYFLEEILHLNGNLHGEVRNNKKILITE